MPGQNHGNWLTIWITSSRIYALWIFIGIDAIVNIVAMRYK